MVLVIGASVWGFASGASSVIQNNYYEEVVESVDKIKERFCIENVGLDKASNKLKIWILNYGTIDITIDMIRITGGSNISYQFIDVVIPINEFVRVDVTPNELYLIDGLSITIEVKSSRGNRAYDSILIP
jgi:hypothetical protein